MEGSPISTIPYITPRLVAVPGIDSPTPRSYNIAPAAAFREGDFVVLQAAAAGKLPAPTGALAAAAGPAASAVTLGTTASAGAPAATYYIITSYTAAGTESLLSQEFVVNCAAGTVPTVNVAAAGAPGAATNFAAYASTVEGGETLQQATKTTTALGTTFTIPNPLINQAGLVRAATNSNASIAGLTLHDSAAVYATGIGGSLTAGGPGNLLGTWGNPPPLAPGDPAQALVVSLVNGQPIEISLAQPWLASMQGTTAGLLLDTSQQAAGVFVADTSQANKVLTILDRLDLGGSLMDTGARVRAIFNSGVI